MTSEIVVSFRLEDATAYGLEEAILLSYFKFWVDKNTIRRINEIEGECYTYISFGRLQKLFPFMSRWTLVRVIKSLEKQKLIIKNFRSGPGVHGGRQMMITLSKKYRAGIATPTMQESQ